MGIRDVTYTLMALGQVSGCSGKRYSAPEIMAEAVNEIVRLIAEVERQTSSALDWASRCGQTQAQLEKVATESETWRLAHDATYAECGELKADAVRYKIPLEQRERAMKANAAYCNELKAENAALAAQVKDYRGALERISCRTDHGNQEPCEVCRIIDAVFDTTQTKEPK